MNNQFSPIHPLSNPIPRIAIIGCGAIAESYYLPALAQHPSIFSNLILVDRDPVRLQQMMETFHVKHGVTDHHSILGETDGVIVALPTEYHAIVGNDFLSCGVPVLCEKPLAENFARAKSMIDTANQSCTPLAVNYLGRLSPHFAQVKEYLSQNTFGKLLSINYIVGELFNWPTVSGFYFSADKSTRGILRDRGAHVVDQICWWLGGKPTLVSSQNDSFGGSEAVAEVRFEYGNCTGHIKLSWFATLRSKFTIQCEGATIEGDVYDYGHLTLLQEERIKNLDLKSPFKTKDAVANRIVSNFIGMICEGEKPLVPGVDVLDSIEFVDECYQAATPFEMPWYELAEVPNA